MKKYCRLKMYNQSSENNKRIAKNSLYMSIRMVIVMCITLYTTRAVLNILGVIDYGIYNVVAGFVSMLAFLNTSMSNATQRFYNYELGRNGEEGAILVYKSSLAIQFFFAIFLVVLAEGVGVWYIFNVMVIPHERFYAAFWIFQFSVVSFFITMIKVPSLAAVMAHERMTFIAVVSIVSSILKLLIVFILLYSRHCDKLIVYGGLLLLVTIVDYISYLWYSRKQFKEMSLSCHYDKNMFKNLLSFSGWNVFGSFSIMMKEQGLSMVMNLFYGPVVNAARGVATQVYGALSSFVSNITTPVRPQMIKAYSVGNIDRAMHLTYSVCKVSCYFYYMMALPVSLEITYVLKVWLGNSIPEHTAAFVIITLATCFTSNLHSAISGVVHATGKMKGFQLSTSSVKLFSVFVAYLFFINGISAEMALVIVMVFDIVAHIVGLIVLRKITTFSILDYFFHVIVPILSVILIAFVFPYVVHEYVSEGLLRLILVALTTVMSVCGISYVLGLDEHEKELVVQMLNGLKKKVSRKYGK